MSEGIIKVAVAGAAGRMGIEVLRTVVAASDMELVAATDRKHVGESVRVLAGPDAPNFQVEDKIGEALDRTKAQVLVDFTHGAVAPDHALSAIKRGVSPVIGTSGMSADDIAVVRKACEDNGVPGCLIPNFAVGAVLMTKFAEMAAEWMPHVEVIEMHHDGKLDAPSGTAIHTAERIAAHRSTVPQKNPNEKLKAEGARGGLVKNVPVHSVRLPGLVAHQMVLFGGNGEMLTIQHDSMNRASFMEGVKLAIRKVRDQEGLIVGLDKLMFD